mgnify:CR=1 FL=1
MKTEAKLLGHANPLVTMKIYTLILDGDIDQAGMALRTVIGAPVPKPINDNAANDQIEWKAPEPAVDNPVVNYELVLTST